MRWTEEQLADFQRGRAPVPTKPRKYRNKPCEADGEKFASKLELERFEQLKLMEAAGEIRSLRAQVPFPLTVGDELIGAYVADAVYEVVATGRRVVEDSKGYKTALYRWKAKHFRAQFGFDITIYNGKR